MGPRSGCRSSRSSATATRSETLSARFLLSCGPEISDRTSTQAASRELYTHVRWTVLASLAPGAQVTAELEAQVSGQVNGASGEAK